MSDPVPPLSVTTGAPSARPVTRAFARKRAALVDISNKAGKSRVAKEGRPAAVESVVLAPNTRIEGADVPAGAPTATGRGPTVTGIDPAPDGDGYRELAPDIFEHFRRIECARLVSSLDVFGGQFDITYGMRSVLVDWLVDVAQEYKVHTDTLFLCVALIDRTLAHYSVSRVELQLLGCACILIAAKYAEVYTPSIDELVYISDNCYTREQMVAMESTVVAGLNFKLSSVTPVQFLHRFLEAAELGKDEEPLPHFILELTLPECDFIGKVPSLVAAAAILYARIAIDRFPSRLWTPELKRLTGYGSTDLWQCVCSLSALHASSRTAHNTLHAVTRKYTGHLHQYVAIRFPPVIGGRLYVAKSLLEVVVGSTSAETTSAPVDV